MNTIRTRSTTFAALAGLSLFVAVSGDSANGQAGGTTSGGSGGRVRSSAGFVPSRRSAFGRPSKISSAIQLLRKAKTDAEKAKAKSALSKSLEERFDADLKSREKEIADIEARVQKLRGILNKRREARDEIIKLQIQVLMNEAAGLGFPSGSRRSGFGSGRGLFPGGARSGSSSFGGLGGFGSDSSNQ